MVREGFLERMVWKNTQGYGKTHQQGHAWGVTWAEVRGEGRT